MKKFTVLRFNSSSVSFSSMQEAEEFAMNCGDFCQFLVEEPRRLSDAELDAWAEKVGAEQWYRND